MTAKTPAPARLSFIVPAVSVPVLAKGAFASLLAAAMSLLLIVAVAPPAAGQTGADLDPEGCADGRFVVDPEAHPGLASDCRALVAIRNHWLGDPDNAALPEDHFLRTWGYGLSWNGVWIGITEEGPRVTILSLHRMDIAGTIPVEISHLTALTELYLNHNHDLHGPIPPELGSLIHLTDLHLNHNRLSGPIPPELGGLVSMKRMALFDNELTGPIPAEFGRLENLTYLDFDRNRMAGPIPPELGNLSNLVMLWMRDNMFTGGLPAELGRLSMLERLYVSGNRLSGPVPDELTALAPANGGSLWVFDHCGNGLAGPMPDALRRIGEEYYDGPFCDDDGNSHETAIDDLAGWGIVGRCDVLDGFCPDDPATRADVAIFIHEAVRRAYGPPERPAPRPVFTDVSPGAPFERAAEWAVWSGVMSAPDGRFGPNGLVTRADMAQILTEAFFHIPQADGAAGTFTDLEGRPVDVVKSIESLHAAGITEGCSADPLLFCPDAYLTRGQLASLLVRSINTVGL